MIWISRVYLVIKMIFFVPLMLFVQMFILFDYQSFWNDFKRSFLCDWIGGDSYNDKFIYDKSGKVIYKF